MNNSGCKAIRFQLPRFQAGASSCFSPEILGTHLGLASVILFVFNVAFRMEAESF